jgi:hypothetical protein
MPPLLFDERFNEAGLHAAAHREKEEERDREWGSGGRRGKERCRERERERERWGVRSTLAEKPPLYKQFRRAHQS